jgi:hypothetical protein
VAFVERPARYHACDEVPGGRVNPQVAGTTLMQVGNSFLLMLLGL